MRILLLISFLLLALCGNGFAASVIVLYQDTAIVDRSPNAVPKANEFNSKRDSVFTDVAKVTMTQDTRALSALPFISLLQHMKGNAPGVYMQESSGEPGAVQEIFIRGLAMPLLSKRDLYQSQPLVVLDGIPLISNEHPFAYDLQQYDYNRIGTATNLLANIDINNIEKIEVLKDMAGAAIYGPRGANGVIVLTSKSASNKRAISFNSYIGMVQRPHVKTVNGGFENDFRKQFYDRYTANGRYSEDDVYPVYLSDSLNTAYYGPSNWTDSYYQSGLIHSISADISGGGERANFRFSIGNANNKGIADHVGLDRYSAMFHINMKPLKWLLFSAMINGNRLDRDRNNNMRDRFSNISYIPDLSAPLAPNDDIYRGYLQKFKGGFDNNFTNLVQGHAKLVFDFQSFKFVSKLAVDYNESYRDVFYPKPLLEGNNYASNYYGFNQRLIFDNLASYNWLIDDKSQLYLEGAAVLQWDVNRYNYSYGYRGVNDFIKINLLESDPDKSNYLSTIAFPRELVYKFLDRTRQNLASFYGKGSYNYKHKYTASLLLRADGSSNAQPTHRWLFTPTLALGWNIKNDLLINDSFWSDLNLRLSAGRVGRLNAYDNYAQGPQYTADIGYTGNKILPAYNAISILSRPYEFGWVGYDIPWAYTNQLNLGLDAAWNNNHLRMSIDGYIKEDKDQILAIPSHGEYGYSQSYEPGMGVKNTGVDLLLSADILYGKHRSFDWTSTLSLSYNQNKLIALPGGLNQIVIGDRLLKIGEPVDQFWLYTNDGIYLSDNDVPNLAGVPLSFNGNSLRAGDPSWEDKNHDNKIDDSDKTLKGNIFPKVVGGWNNDFRYGNWTLGVNLYFNLGRELLNQEMANRFDFINREGVNEMNSVKEITYWEKRGDYNKYPLYNPWSTVIPYRPDQDLFLENASFLKLRSLTMGYDLSPWLKKKSSKLKRVYIYGSASNLFTVSPYSGRDPELVDYTGRDTGYGMQIPKTYTIGVKMDL